MAGDWIKVDTTLPDKPEVWQMAGILGLGADDVVGKLIRVWAWFDSHTEDGNAVGVSYPLVDRVAGVIGFAEAMALCGWLAQNGSTLSVPKFGRHNGKSAKARALTNERVSKHRKSNAAINAQSNADAVTPSVSKTVTREEKRREEELSSPTVQRVARKRATVPKPADVEAQTWEDWNALRKAKRAPVTATVIDAAKAEAIKAGLTLEQFLRVWCQRGSQGLQADWLKPQERSALVVPMGRKSDALMAGNIAAAQRFLEGS